MWPKAKVGQGRRTEDSWRIIKSVLRQKNLWARSQAAGQPPAPHVYPKPPTEREGRHPRTGEAQPCPLRVLRHLPWASETFTGQRCWPADLVI